MYSQGDPNQLPVIEGCTVPLRVAVGALFLNRVVGLSGLVAGVAGHRRMEFFQRKTGLVMIEG
jgi:hypothetical protein